MATAERSLLFVTDESSPIPKQSATQLYELVNTATKMRSPLNVANIKALLTVRAKKKKSVLLHCGMDGAWLPAFLLFAQCG